MAAKSRTQAHKAAYITSECMRFRPSFWGAFILLERRMSNPLVDLQHFRHKYFSLSLVSNVTFHFSMLATMTLVPIIVELGYNKPPIWVPLVLLPNQIIGLVMTFTAGWIYDKYQPKLLRPAAMVSIASGFLLLGIFIGGITVPGCGDRRP